MNRRHFLASAAAIRLAAAPPRASMGIASTSYLTVWRPRDAYEYLEHCNALGAGGIQTSLNSLELADLSKLRGRAEQLGMYVEVMNPLPAQDTARFEALLKGARQVGALCARVACLSGRRYETFHTLAEWKKFVADSHAAIERALPLAEKHKVPLAIENHKDWTADEFVALLRKFNSPHLGVCLDLGNNISLLDDPMELVEALAPYTLSTHIKDMGVASYKDGFLLSEVPLGEGLLDLKKMLAVIRKAKPGVKMTLEMITRNPLQIPCLTEKYWVTFPEREARRLARALSMVRDQKKTQPLPSMDGLDRKAQLEYEEENVKLSLNYAREQLGL